MTKNKKYVFKSFLPHQYEKEEAFLSKMSRDGWQFVKLYAGLPTKYEFDKAEPTDYVYQLDYVVKEEDTESYHQLFSDAGWEEFYSWDGIYSTKWYYFRRLREDGKDNKIFTDTESKINLYDKLLKKYGLFFLIIFALEANCINMVIGQLFNSTFPSVRGILLLIPFTIIILIIILYLYLIFGIIMKKNQLMNNLKNQL